MSPYAKRHPVEEATHELARTRGAITSLTVVEAGVTSWRDSAARVLRKLLGKGLLTRHVGKRKVVGSDGVHQLRRIAIYMPTHVAGEASEGLARERAVCALLADRGVLSTQEVADACDLRNWQAARVLARLRKAGTVEHKLVAEGASSGRQRMYWLADEVPA